MVDNKNMEEVKLEIGTSCHLVKITYGVYVEPDISLDYTEHSPDPWYGDSVTSICIDEPKAREIIAFLQDAFDI